MAKLTIYFTSDLHGYLFPTNYADGAVRDIGLLSMHFPKDGNHARDRRGRIPCKGRPLTYYCHARGLPGPMARAMNARGYDYVTLGNHDFNYGYGAVSEHLHELEASCLCANVRDARGELPIGACEIRTLENGVRVGACRHRDELG